MISQRKMTQIERNYRSVLYRRPIGIGSVLMVLCVSIFSVGIALSAANVSFPFYSLYVGTFATLIIAFATDWLLRAMTSLMKREWSGIVIGCFGAVLVYLGSWLLCTAVAALIAP